MLGFILLVLIVCALIAIIWGKEAAQGCFGIVAVGAVVVVVLGAGALCLLVLPRNQSQPIITVAVTAFVLANVWIWWGKDAFFNFAERMAEQERAKMAQANTPPPPQASAPPPPRSAAAPPHQSHSASGPSSPRPDIIYRCPHCFQKNKVRGDWQGTDAPDPHPSCGKCGARLI